MARQAFPSVGEISGYYAQQNAGKRNLSADLNVPGAREVVLRLCETADVIIENFRPGTLASFGLDYETISARNPSVLAGVMLYLNERVHADLSDEDLGAETPILG